MKYVKAGLLLLFILAVGIFILFKIKGSNARLSNPPVIEDTIESFHVNCDFTDEDLLRGLTAEDDEDGNITDQIMTGEFTPLKDGNTSTYNCVVFDSDGQYCEYNRTVVFDDYVSPVIGLTEPLMYYTGSLAVKKPRSYLYARDKLDGDITYRIELSDSTIDYKTRGNYFITVSVDNRLGDRAEYEIPVHVLDKTSILYIHLTQYIAYVKLNSVFDPMKYVEGTSNDKYAPEAPYVLNMKSNVNTAEKGVYEVEYTLSNESNSVPGKTFLTVIVYE